MKAISPLLQLKEVELIINFMLEHIRRFIVIPDPALMSSFVDLFGSEEVLNTFRSIPRGIDRDDAIVDTYLSRIRATGAFPYCVSSVILNKELDKTHFHLVYATRNIHGLTTFREVESGAFSKQKNLRAELHHEKKQKLKDGGKQLNFVGPAMEPDPFLDNIENHYKMDAREKAFHLIQTHNSILYDSFLAVVLQTRLVKKTMVNSWIRDWGSKKLVKISGLSARETTPKIGGQNIISIVNRPQ